MVERSMERRREPEPEENSYDRKIRLNEEAIRRKLQGKMVIKGEPWLQNRQGLTKQYVNEGNWDEVAVPNWHIFIQRIVKHSGCHIHQGGLAIYVLEGKGYSVVDSVRYDWEEGDLIVLPIKAGGVEHQHFNEDPDKAVLWMAFRYEPMLDQVTVGFKQVVDHPDWMSPKKR
ncbi:MAG: cupin domain-containing protein [Dehalococcoidia bacterium]|nr:cupin domain-containing protein [Dehalococcoidia bacterium]MDZ4247595.1 cupin domain-containing protein [Dehalococcoidia bacterium]